MKECVWVKPERVAEVEFLEWALREAGLIRRERRGVKMHNTSRCAEIEQRFPGLIRAIVNAHAIQSKEQRFQ